MILSENVPFFQNVPGTRDIFWILAEKLALLHDALLFEENPSPTAQVNQVIYRSVLCWHWGLRKGFKPKVNTSNTLVKVDIFQCNESKVSVGQGKPCSSKGMEVKGEDWVLWFQESCEWILANAMQPSAVFEDPTLLLWALVLIPLPPCHRANLPVNICCSWPTVSVGRL